MAEMFEMDNNNFSVFGIRSETESFHLLTLNERLLGKLSDIGPIVP